jgi:replicative DNA helicase
MSDFCDSYSEKVVLGNLLLKGSSSYFFVNIYLSKSDFLSPKHQAIYSCIEDICSELDVSSITVDTIVSSVSKLGLSDIVSVDYISDVKSSSDMSMTENELKSFVNNIRFWSTVRKFKNRISGLDKYLDNITPQKPLSEIIAHAEKSVLDFIPDILNEEEITNVGEFASDYIEHLSENPVDVPGIPSGFPRYDNSIGGGFRRGSVNVIGARPKIGKSTFCLNVSKNVTNQDIPVLYLDTEMTKETQTVKWVSLNSGVNQNLIETGKFVEKNNLKNAVNETLENIKTKKFNHINISGKSPDEYFSLMRRWVNTVVGRDENGRINDCLVVLDYLKTMNLDELGSHQEYQHLGDIVTKLHNFSVKYDVPILSAVQLNRDGINREDAGVVSASDRILWLCTNLAFLKKKSDEDVAAGDSLSNGDRKMIVVETRFGSGMDASSEYINIQSKLECCQLTEGKFNYEAMDETNTLNNINLDPTNEEAYNF